MDTYSLHNQSCLRVCVCVCRNVYIAIDVPERVCMVYLHGTCRNTVITLSKNGNPPQRFSDRRQTPAQPLFCKIWSPQVG